GASLLSQARGPEPVRALGATVGLYAAFAMAPVLGLAVVDEFSRITFAPWAIGCAGAGLALAVAAAALMRRPSPILIAASIALTILAVVSSRKGVISNEWLADAAALAAPLCLIVAGMLDDIRPRVVAGWIGLAVAISAITWTVQGSLLGRSLFLAIAGGTAILIALALERLLPRESAR